MRSSDVLASRGYQADHEAIFNLTYLEIVQMLERRIAACDAVVCLVGFAYGGEPGITAATRSLLG